MDKYLNVGRKIIVVRYRCYEELVGMKGTIVDICLCGCGAYCVSFKCGIFKLHRKDFIWID